MHPPQVNYVLLSVDLYHLFNKKFCGTEEGKITDRI